jgi:LmbE family N-acetylglucosaminyl deacetylase
MTELAVQQGTGRRILLSQAHPDDETFGLGAAIARYVAEGVDISLICATNGEQGDVAPEYMDGHESIADVRLAELACATQYLGIQDVVTFGYRDSGMMGTPENEHPDSLWQADLDVLAGQVVEVIRRVRPQVVITFDPYGGYGHPDHIAIHKATVQAFHAAGDPEQYPDQVAAGLAPYQPQKLYYTAFPRIFVRLGVAMARLTGKDPRRMGRNNDLDMVAIIEATLPTHARLDLRGYYDAWMEASACHASQQGPGGFLPLPRMVLRQLFGWQSFYRAWPEVNGQRGVERDLFDGVQVD